MFAGRREEQKRKDKEETVLYIKHPTTKERIFIKRIELLAEITKNTPQPPIGIGSTSDDYMYIKIPGTNTRRWIHKNEINPHLGDRPEDYDNKGNLKHNPEQWLPWLGFGQRTPLPKSLFNFLPIQKGSALRQRFNIEEKTGITINQKRKTSPTLEELIQKNKTPPIPPTTPIPVNMLETEPPSPPPLTLGGRLGPLWVGRGGGGR